MCEFYNAIKGTCVINGEPALCDVCKNPKTVTDDAVVPPPLPEEEQLVASED